LAKQASNPINKTRSLNHRNLPRLNIIRQPDNLRALLNERRLSQLGNVFSHAVLNPSKQKEKVSFFVTRQSRKRPKTYDPVISPKLIASISFFLEGAISSSESRTTGSG
jgi:hypothetical protein